MNQPSSPRLHGSVFPVLAEAIKGLEYVEEKNRSLDDFLDFELQNQQIRRTVSHLLFTCFRYKSAIDRLIATRCERPPKPSLHRLLSAGIALANFQTAVRPEATVNAAVEYAKQHFNPGAAKFVNALLRRSCTDLSLHSATLPPLLLRRWEKRFNAEVLQQLTENFLTPAPFTFRLCNRTELTEDECLALDAKPLANAADPFHFYQSDSPAKVLASSLLSDGSLYIQDPATMLAPGLIRGETPATVLDLCGAPGGKALMLAELFCKDTKFVVSDRSAKRQQLTRENLLRHHVEAEILVADALNFPAGRRFDLVFCDVPCTNTGVFRRRPDALWRFTEKTLQETVKLQHDILDHASKLVLPGGALVYSTCSIEPEEDQLQVKNFIQNHPDFELSGELLHLPSSDADGAYAALFHKKTCT